MQLKLLVFVISKKKFTPSLPRYTVCRKWFRQAQPPSTGLPVVRQAQPSLTGLSLTNAICIIDLNPVAIGVLKVKLFDTVFPNVVLVSCSGPVVEVDL